MVGLKGMSMVYKMLYYRPFPFYLLIHTWELSICMRHEFSNQPEWTHTISVDKTKHASMKAKTSDFFSQRLTFCSAIHFDTRSSMARTGNAIRVSSLFSFGWFRWTIKTAKLMISHAHSNSLCWPFSVFVFVLLSESQSPTVCYQLHITSDEMAKLFNVAIFGNYDVIYNITQFGDKKTFFEWHFILLLFVFIRVSLSSNVEMNNDWEIAMFHVVQ